MNNYELSMPIGIGDLIVSKSLLTSLKNTNVNMELGPACFQYRGPDYRKFVIEFVRNVFVEPMFRLHEDPIGRPYKDWPTLFHEGLSPTPLSLTQNLSKGKDLGKERYICLNTKVRGVYLDDFIKNKDRFSSIISSLSKKIHVVLIGERSIEFNLEYDKSDQIFKKKQIFSIYEMLPKMDVSDMTVSQLGITSPSLEKLMQDSKYMCDASATINLGVGGNLVLSNAVCKKTINLFVKDPHYVDCRKVLKIMNNGFEAHDWQGFFGALENLTVN